MITLIDYWQLLVLVAVGILIFLVIDVFGHAWESMEESVSNTFAGNASISTAIISLFAMFGGLGIGLLGLTWYESKYMKRSVKLQRSLSSYKEDAVIVPGIEEPGNSYLQRNQSQQQQQQQLFQDVNAYKLATMIAIGIGAHNFSEGLAIGQSYVSGAIALAVLLIIGFGAHNATEGFGIAGPLTGVTNKPKVRFLILAGLIGGGPTFIVTIIGSLWNSSIAYILFLAIAGGALVYVSMLMYKSERRQTTNNILMLGIFVGLFAGFITDLIIAISGA